MGGTRGDVCGALIERMAAWPGRHGRLSVIIFVETILFVAISPHFSPFFKPLKNQAHLQGPPRTSPGHQWGHTDSQSDVRWGPLVLRMTRPSYGHSG